MCYLEQVKSNNGRSASEFILTSASRGKYHFTTREAQTALGISPIAARAALRRLRGKGHIATPFRGFHVIVPPEYRRIGCLPAEQFLPHLMAHLGVPYYGALLSAAHYYGATHQQPQVFQVMTPANRAPITCGRVCVTFIARKNLANMSTRQINTPRGYLQISSPEVTALDLVGYVKHAGGLDNVATVLSELGHRLDAGLIVTAATSSPLPWAQRLGLLLDRVGFSDLTDPLATHLGKQVKEITPLRPGANTQNAPRDSRWKVAVNAEIKPDL